MKSLSITTSEHFLNLTSPTDSSEEAFKRDIVNGERSMPSAIDLIG
jgi:hypothetical protein